MVSPAVTLKVLTPVVNVQVEAVPVLLPNVPAPRSVPVVVSQKSTLPAVGAVLPDWADTLAVKVTGVPYTTEACEALTVIVVAAVRSVRTRSLPSPPA